MFLFLIKSVAVVMLLFLDITTSFQRRTNFGFLTKQNSLSAAATGSARVKECRTWVSIKKKKTLEGKNEVYLDQKELFNSYFELHEFLDRYIFSIG